MTDKTDKYDQLVSAYNERAALLEKRRWLGFFDFSGKSAIDAEVKLLDRTIAMLRQELGLSDE